MRSAGVVAEGKPSSQEGATATALQRSVENNPLFTIPAASAGLVACHVRYLPCGETVLKYEFRDHAWLRVAGNEHIEYMEQTARFNHFRGKRSQNPSSPVSRMRFLGKRL